jgi:probable phosphoglycerate mutase
VWDVRVLSLHLIRHGQTEFSRENLFCGTIDPPLTQSGREMGIAIAEAYGAMKWEAIYTSMLQRTIATAEPLAQRVGLAIRKIAALGEIAYGEWEGKSQEDVARSAPAAYQRWLDDPASHGTPGGETAFQVAARALPVIDDIREKHPDGNVLVVSHKATIRIIVCALLEIDVRAYRDRIGQPVGALTVFDFKERGPLLRMLGDRSHLPAKLRHVEGT